VVRVLLEHLTVVATSPNLLMMRIDREPLSVDVDPVEAGFGRVVDALSHSTSWRYEDATVILTFIHVLADGSALDAQWTGTPEDLEGHAVACHAVRHLHFLRHTDSDVADAPGLPEFWAFASRVADHHYPAVAGLLAEHDLGRMDFSI